MLNKNYFNISFLNFLSFLCASIIPFLVLGPFIPDLIISLSSIWFIYYSIKNKLVKYYKNIYFYFFLGFCLICIFSSIISENIFFSLKSSLFYFRIGIFALLISFLIDSNKKILDYFYYFFLFTFFILTIDGFYQYFTGVNLIGYEVHGVRVSSFFGDEHILGSYLARLFPLFFALFVIRKSKKIYEITAVSIIFVMVDVMIFLSAERTAFFLFNLSTLFIIIFISRYKILRLVLLIISILIISTITLNSQSLFERYVKSPVASIGIGNDDNQKYMFSPGHDSLIRSAFKMFQDKPLFGHGPKMFSIKCNDPKYINKNFKCHPHPHNFYAQLLAETGILGFSFLIGLFIYFIILMINHSYFFFKDKQKLLSDYQICLLGGLLISIWPFITSGNFFTNNLMMLYSLQFGFFKKIKN